MSTRRLEQLLKEQAPPKERADAARNRERILQAAERLFAERGAVNVSMDEIAEAAGCGKGTLYRRFTDQSGLALALLEEKESQLQEAVVRGPAPLGPEAPPRERLFAFFDALLDLLEINTELHIVFETSSSGARYRRGRYGFLRLHVEILLKEIDENIDAPVMADLLLAAVQSELFRNLRHERGVSLKRLKRETRALIEGVIGEPG